MYHLKFAAYCGMGWTIGSFEERGEARSEAASILRQRRSDGYAIATLKQGREWEVLEPEDSVLVPDECGQLYITHQTFECRECGFKHETDEARRACCLEELYCEECGADQPDENLGVDDTHDPSCSLYAK